MYSWLSATCNYQHRMKSDSQWPQGVEIILVMQGCVQNIFFLTLHTISFIFFPRRFPCVRVWQWTPPVIPPRNPNRNCASKPATTVGAERSSAQESSHATSALGFSFPAPTAMFCAVKAPSSGLSILWLRSIRSFHDLEIPCIMALDSILWTKISFQRPGVTH